MTATHSDSAWQQLHLLQENSVGNLSADFHVLVLVGIVLTWRAVNILFEVVEAGDFGDICVGFDSSAAGSASVALGGRVQ